MNKFIIFTLASGFCLSLFIIVYQILLKSSSRFNLCRLYLVSSILLSVLIPLTPIDLGINLIKIDNTRTIVKPTNETQTEVIDQVSVVTNDNRVEDKLKINPVNLIGGIILLISILLFIRFIYRFGSIILIQTSGHRLETNGGFNLIFTDKTDNAFSFLGYIFINPKKFNDEEKRLIIEHEVEHVRHFHSIDLILIELLIIIQWFNPFTYILRRNLIEIHEFIADKGVLRNGVDPYSYQNLLLSVVTSSSLPTAGNQLSALITKKRIAMIGNMNYPNGRWTNFLVMIPLTIVLIILVSAFTPIYKPLKINEFDIANQKQLPDTQKTVNSDEIFLVVEKMPSFGNGDANEFRTWVAQNLKYPEEAKIKGIQGRVFVQFIVEADGSLTNHKIIRGVDPILDNEALRIVSISPKWNPGMQRGKPVRVSFTFPIAFVNVKNKHTNDPSVTLINDVNTDNQIFEVVETMPCFGSGDANDFREWISANLKYPAIAAEKGIQGRVFVQFVIEQDGSVTNAKILRGVDPALDQEALRLIQASPKWNPGKQNGNPVRVKFTFPINFYKQ